MAIVLEYWPGGSLENAIDQDYFIMDNLPIEFREKFVFGQIALALGYMHRKGVCHADLKVYIDALLDFTI